jgi:hypothetical protein
MREPAPQERTELAVARGREPRMEEVGRREPEPPERTELMVARGPRAELTWGPGLESAEAHSGFGPVAA